jgi:hypothetical protein
MTLSVIFFFALYDTLVHYMIYKDANTPSAICDKNQRNTLYYVEYRMVLFFFLSRAGEQDFDPRENFVHKHTLLSIKKTAHNS